ncbi:MAG: transglycosylase domain-containing protein [Solobacterium sp.]|nr:transglycosylase domain-containing protein [Solobacterium sp.]
MSTQQKKPTTKKVVKRTTQPKQTKKKASSRRKVNRLHLWTVILAFLVVLELLVATFGIFWLNSMLKNRPEIIIDDFFSAESSHIYDRNGTLIADVGAQLRENVTYNELSESLIDAFLAVEDSRFFAHNGFDVPRFAKAIVENAKAIITRSSSRQGGSTFTMQLVKLTYFQNEEAGIAKDRDLEYKIQQIVLAQDLEKRTNKKAIFEMYLNKMNFGGTGNIRGVEKASIYYYGKHASELNLAESAMLAGVINSPYYYDPHNFLDYATNRRNNVLRLMRNHGYITSREYELATSIRVEDTLVNPYERQRGGTGAAYAYQSYIDSVINEVTELTGQDPLTVAMDIYTYMDPVVQTKMDDIQSGKVESVVFPDDLMECGMIAENNQTGEIVAIGGGRNYGRGGSMLLNHATQQFKQPGSSVKPIIDYALAFEYLGWATSHVVTDRPLIYEGTDMVIKNASGSYGGEMTLQYAVSMSLNTPAIQALQDVINTAGWQTTVDYIKSLGFSQVTDENFDIGFAIGGSNFTCSVEELAAAHAVLMNGGNYIQPHTVQRIVFRNGTQAPIEPQYEARNVLSPQAAYLAAHLMQNVVPQYIFTQLLQRDYPVYAKTGTTDWGSEGLQYNIPNGASKDKWMVCETGQFTTAVWVGYEMGVKDKDTYFNDAKQNMNIQGHISNELLSILNDEIWPAGVERPEGISDITHILGTFPYAAPVEGMNPALLTSGMVKSDRATLVDAQASMEVDPINEFTAAYEEGGVALHWGAYPDATKLEVAPDTMDISLRNPDGSPIVEAWGRRLFDYSWVYGPIRYQATIKQNGNVIAEVMTDQMDHFEALELEAGATIEACGFYGFENGSNKSTEICTSFTTPEKPKEETDPEKEKEGAPTPESGETNLYIPPQTENLDTVRAWAASYNTTCETVPRTNEYYPDAVTNPQITNIFFIDFNEPNGGTVLAGDRYYPDNTKVGCWIFN